MSATLPESVVERYVQPLPRYTSYPTVPSWLPIELAEVEALVRAETADPVAVYVHVPFCERLCTYCGCNALVRRDAESHARYVETVRREVERVRALTGQRALLQLHFGGGTPTLLSPAHLEAIVTAVLAAFPPAPAIDMSIEIDPMVTDAAYLRHLRGLGFARLSLGVQSFDARVQEAIGRMQSAATSRQVFRWAREAGFPSINLDLMIGLPYQDAAGVARDAEAAAELGADRVALFGYAHVPEMRPLQRRLEAFGLPDWRARWAMIQRAAEAFAGLGYEPVGMDHFARPDDALSRAARGGTLRRNFQGYVAAAAPALFGFGVSAISSVANSFVQGCKTLGEYYAADAASQLPVSLGYRRSADDTTRSALIEMIMCRLRVDYAAASAVLGLDVRRVFAEEIAALAPLASDGLITLDDAGFALVEAARPLVRAVASRFDAHLAEAARRRRLSRAV